MAMRTLPGTDLSVFPLCLGGNVFGWTADETASLAVLDAFTAAGGNFIDTADVYSAWAPGHAGGESETIVGRWMAARRNRDRLVIATKVGMLASRKGLSAANIRAAAEDSLRRLGTDRIDLYYAHVDDAATSLEETLRAFDDLKRSGKIRYAAASNYTVDRLREALDVSSRNHLTRYVALQPHFNLMERSIFQGPLQALCVEERIGCLPYYGLARGFLTGKYRPGVTVQSPRASGASAYLNDRGLRVLSALDEIASGHRTTVAAVALAWVAAQPAVIAPIASARSVSQLEDLLPAAGLSLLPGELAILTAASSVSG